ncbi:uncharacterized protein LOC130677844 [Microplitis mediator]|uniref:uncharacterized protein LOC130677844 n=1 Tax=Microplitis mediator TaxID=375433 RepID=UPI002557B03F|nr:uncharacterized protein LOC130677844 [Microplitis mediator]XP_057340711.1 uncharacterized protein LOC130677844 [Microplitis mediator]
MQHAIDCTNNDNEHEKLRTCISNGKSKSSDTIIEDLFKIKLPSNWKKLNDETKRKFICQWARDALPNLPETLMPITVGSTVDGDSEKSIDEIPKWLDREKFLRGQKFAQDNLIGVFATTLLTLFGIYSFEDGFKPLIATGKSSEPYTAFKRYLSTIARFRNWYTSDPWTKGTQAYNDIRTVRRVHAIVRDKLNVMSNEDVDKAAKIENPWSPMRNILLEDFKSGCPVSLPGQCPFLMESLGTVRPKKMNQGEMALTQGSFVCLIILYPQAFGIHGATDDDLDDFCYVWRGIGYLLGIEDEFNFCQGSFDDIKQRSVDYLNEWVKPNLRDITPEWEHMIRCLMSGIQYYIPGMSYEISLLYAMELMNIDMPRLRSSLSYSDWIKHHLIKFTMNYACRFQQVKKYLNIFFDNCVNRALQFTEGKHAKLRVRSSKTLNSALLNKHE